VTDIMSSRGRRKRELGASETRVGGLNGSLDWWYGFWSTSEGASWGLEVKLEGQNGINN
jgi:hypothetical protein